MSTNLIFIFFKTFEMNAINGSRSAVGRRLSTYKLNELEIISFKIPFRPLCLNLDICRNNRVQTKMISTFFEKKIQLNWIELQRLIAFIVELFPGMWARKRVADIIAEILFWIQCQWPVLTSRDDHDTDRMSLNNEIKTNFIKNHHIYIKN